MKKVFLRILPLAAAVLLATSCSKDENNDNAVVNDGQETVITTEKTVTVSGTASKKAGLSKISCADGKNLTFDGGEIISISGDDGNIHGNAELAADGSFTVELSYPADKEESYLLDKSFTATIGTNPTDVKGSYGDIDAAAADIYEVSSNVVALTQGEDGLAFSEAFSMCVEVAFVENKKSNAISVKVGENDAVELAAGQICIVPAGATVIVTADGKTKTGTVAGEIYTIKQTYTLKTDEYKVAEDANSQKTLEMLENQGGHKIANVTLPYTFSIRNFGNKLASNQIVTGTPTVDMGSSYVTISDIQGSGTSNYFNVTVTAATNEEINISFKKRNQNSSNEFSSHLTFYIIAD